MRACLSIGVRQLRPLGRRPLGLPRRRRCSSGGFGAVRVDGGSREQVAAAAAHQQHGMRPVRQHLGGGGEEEEDGKEARSNKHGSQDESF